jgi:hypothetical protein
MIAKISTGNMGLNKTTITTKKTMIQKCSGILNAAIPKNRELRNSHIRL